MTAIAFLGLGRMGAPMATRLVKAGHAVTVWNRTARPDRVPDGARVKATPDLAVAGAEIVFTMVTDARALDDVLTGPDGVLTGAEPGAVLVDMSTIGPDAARTVAGRVTDAGLRFLDAPVSGSIPAAEAGTLLMMAGGDEASFARVRPIVATFTREQLHLGPVGSGAAMKVALNLMLAAFNQSLAECLAIAERAGIDRASAYEVIAGGALAAPYVEYKRANFLAPENGEVAFSVELMCKDVELGLALAAAGGVQAGTGRAAAMVLDQAVSAGLGGRDIAAVLELLRPVPAEDIDPDGLARSNRRPSPR